MYFKHAEKFILRVGNSRPGEDFDISAIFDQKRYAQTQNFELVFKVKNSLIDEKDEIKGTWKALKSANFGLLAKKKVFIDADAVKASLHLISENFAKFTALLQLFSVFNEIILWKWSNYKK